MHGQATDVSLAMLYPYPGLPNMDRGTARRTVPLVSLLAERFPRVAVLCPRPEQARWSGVEFMPIPETPRGTRLLELAFKLYDGLTYHGLGRPDLRARRQWWNFIRPLLDRGLQRSMREAVAVADVVLLEYPFWSRSLESAMEKNRKPVLLTMYDLLSGACRDPWLKRRVHNCEMAAARRADAVVCVTAEDADAVRADGVEATYIPHGFVLPGGPNASEERPDDLAVEEIARRVRSGATLCLFLGSSLIPNQEAAAHVLSIARSCPQDAGLIFATAGSCCGPGKPHENMFSLGPVSEKDLGILYGLSRIALAPLESGTGASLKVVEAMAQGKALVTTRAGIRGYPGIRDGEQALVCDELGIWPQMLAELSRDPQRRERIAAAGREFSRAFDYRVVYQPYVDTILALSRKSR